MVYAKMLTAQTTEVNIIQDELSLRKIKTHAKDSIADLDEKNT